MSPAPIEVDDLVVCYGERRAVDGISFTVEPGEIVALLGPNGAGKTTTVETLEGFHRPHAGRVRVLGLDPIAEHGSVTPRIGAMPQTPGIHPGIRPLEALRLYASFYDRPEDPASLLERVALTDRRQATVRQLSGGEQQRLSLALALVGRPEVAFLDEPTAGVDVAGRHVVRTLVRELRDRGVAVLVTTHDLDDAERSADRIVIIDHGRVLAAGTPAALMRVEESDEFHFAAAPSLDTAGLGAALGVTVDVVTSGEYRVRAAPTPATVAALTAWLAEHDLPLGDLRAGRQRLEDVFLRLTRDAPET